MLIVRQMPDCKAWCGNTDSMAILTLQFLLHSLHDNCINICISICGYYLHELLLEISCAKCNYIGDTHNYAYVMGHG